MSRDGRGPQRVREALARLGVEAEVVTLPTSTRTAAEAARAVGCDLGQIAKSLVFRGRGTAKPVLVVASGVHRVDLATVADSCGEEIERPDADFVRRVTGFAIGGVPPVGHRQRLETYLDEALFLYATVWAAAGSPSSLFAVDPRELERVTGAPRLAVAAAERGGAPAPRA